MISNIISAGVQQKLLELLASIAQSLRVIAEAVKEQTEIKEIKKEEQDEHR